MLGRLGLGVNHTEGRRTPYKRETRSVIPLGQESESRLGCDWNVQKSKRRGGMQNIKGQERTPSDLFISSRTARIAAAACDAPMQSGRWGETKEGGGVEVSAFRKLFPQACGKCGEQMESSPPVLQASWPQGSPRAWRGCAVQTLSSDKKEQKGRGTNAAVPQPPRTPDASGSPARRPGAQVGGPTGSAKLPSGGLLPPKIFVFCRGNWAAWKLRRCGLGSQVHLGSSPGFPPTFPSRSNILRHRAWYEVQRAARLLRRGIHAANFRRPHKGSESSPPWMR